MMFNLCKTRTVIAALLLGLTSLIAAGPASAQSYTVSAIGPIGNGWSRPFAVNELGQVVGQSYLTTNNGLAFLYQPSTGVQILPALPGSTKAQANDINNAGQVVGRSGAGFLWDALNGTRRIDRIADSSGVTAWSLGWSIDNATSINAGGAILCSGAYVDPATGLVDASAACIWRMATDPTTGASSLTVIKAPRYGGYAIADLNDHDVNLAVEIGPTGNPQWALWDSNTTLFSWIDPVFQQAAALNNSGVAVSKFGQVFRPGIGVTSLGTLGSGAYAYDINDANQVVGYSSSKSGNSALPFLWQNGAIRNLQSLSNAGNSWKLGIASGMSNPTNTAGTGGYIVGWGNYKNQAVGWILAPR